MQMNNNAQKEWAEAKAYTGPTPKKENMKIALINTVPYREQIKQKINPGFRNQSPSPAPQVTNIKIPTSK